MVLVTGATGLVGSHLLLRLLEKGENIRALYRNPTKINAVKLLFTLRKKQHLFENIEWFEADITDIPSLETAFEGIDFVYHCAGLISFDPNNEEILRKTNIEGTANIANLCLSRTVKKLCYVSSIAALGDLHDNENTVTEETEWNPEKYHSDYAISKYGAEMEVRRAQQEGLNIAIVNPGIIIGPIINPGNDERSGGIFSKVASGLPFYTKGNTGFVAIEDVTQIMVRLMQSGISGERYIVVSENISFEKLLRLIAENLKVRSPKTYVRKWLTEIAWRIDWILSAILPTKRKLPKAIAIALHATDLYGNEKIKKELDFEFIPITESVKMTVAYFSAGL
jgi:nucleoside-diphosphate-sugar epimerase